MLDYSSYLNLKIPMLLGFDIDEESNQIICQFSNSAFFIMSYSEENVEELIKTLETQHKTFFKSKEQFEKLNNEYRDYKIALFGEMVTYLAIATILKEKNHPNASSIFYMAIIVIGLLYAKNDRNYNNTCEILEELNKNELFLKYEQYLNKTIRNNPDIIYALEDRFKDIAIFMIENNFKLDINNIEVFNYNEMEYIINTVVEKEKEEELKRIKKK